jgi:hypothetical protein
VQQSKFAGLDFIASVQREESSLALDKQRQKIFLFSQKLKRQPLRVHNESGPVAIEQLELMLQQTQLLLVSENVQQRQPVQELQ